jgi:hypothetical protein
MNRVVEARVSHDVEVPVQQGLWMLDQTDEIQDVACLDEPTLLRRARSDESLP